MARPLRIEYEGAFYHVTARGNERKEIFQTKKDYERFKYYIMEAKDKYDFLLHAYVLMRNHYHLIIETPKANLNKIMHYINTVFPLPDPKLLHFSLKDNTGHNRVVIGYSDRRNVFITNDLTRLGRNYEIPYADFEELWSCRS